MQPSPIRKCEKIASLSGHKDPISSIAYSPDDSRLVVACENTFYLWDTKVRRKVPSEITRSDIDYSLEHSS